MPEKLDFLTPTTLRVLEFFLASPTDILHEREVLRKAKISKGSANKILRKLAALDLLSREKKGRMVFYGLNIRNPAVKQFKILRNIWSLRQFVAESRPEAKKIILFGSCAEGTDVADSDIDLFLLSEEKSPIKNAVSRFNLKNEKRISPIILNAHELLKMKKDDRPLFERIDRGIVLWEAD
jgi:predicted nucleotidyltransferase